VADKKKGKGAIRSVSPATPDARILPLYWTSHGIQLLEEPVAKYQASTAERSRYGTGLGLKCQNRDDLIRLLRRGLPVSAFANLQAEIGVSTQVLARVTHIATRTLSRRKREGHLDTDESERLFRIGALFDRAVEVLGDKEAAREWFKTPLRALAGQSPLEYADTEPGAREVEDLLGRVEHGVFS
jgi:putative toxin-antitoxin system antitoxin component (TIGR02293 family)